MALDAAIERIVGWLMQELGKMKATGQFLKDQASVTRVSLSTLAIDSGTGATESEGAYDISASAVDIERLFEESGRTLSHGLHMAYWQAHGDRDARDVKVEVIVLARDHVEMTALESQAEQAFDTLYDTHKKAIGKLVEKRRSEPPRISRRPVGLSQTGLV